MLEEMRSTFSIVTCSFKDLANLKETAASVLKQDYPLEWIIIDGDSGQEHRIFLNSLKSNTHKIKWVSEKDKGIYDGMNKGFNLTTGEVVLFLNSGDTLVESDTVRKVIQVFIETQCSWAVALAVRIDGEGHPRAVWEYLKPEIGGLALGTRTFCHQSTFYSRELITSVLPYDNTNLAADHLLNIRAFKRSAPQMIPRVTTFFKDGGVSANRPFRAAMKDLHRIRVEERLLLGNSKLFDVLISTFVVSLVNFGGFTWNLMRKVSRKLVKDSHRVSPPISS